MHLKADDHFPITRRGLDALRRFGGATIDEDGGVHGQPRNKIGALRVLDCRCAIKAGVTRSVILNHARASSRDHRVPARHSADRTGQGGDNVGNRQPTRCST
jgi:hypothetical protein